MISVGWLVTSSWGKVHCPDWQKTLRWCWKSNRNPSISCEGEMRNQWTSHGNLYLPAWCLLDQAPHAHREWVGLKVKLCMWFISVLFYTGLQVWLILWGTPRSVAGLVLLHISLSCRLGLQYMHNCMYTHRSRISSYLHCFHHLPISNWASRLIPGAREQTHTQPPITDFWGRQGKHLLNSFSLFGLVSSIFRAIRLWWKHLPIT